MSNRTHISHLESGFSEFKNKLLVMASHAESIMNTAVRSVIERDTSLANDAEAADSIIDRLEMEMDDLGIKILSQAPLARDLRMITSGMKIAKDLERVGDESTTIARQARVMAEAPNSQTPERIPEMANMVGNMLSQSLSAFVSGNTQSAKAVVKQDKKVDALNKEVRSVAVQAISENKLTVDSGLNYIVISRCLERIGDHAKNIARDVVYLFEAKDIRHPKLSSNS